MNSDPEGECQDLGSASLFKSKWGIPERDIWFLGTLDQGSARCPELLGRRRRRRQLEIKVDIQARKL